MCHDDFNFDESLTPVHLISNDELNTVKIYQLKKIISKLLISISDNNIKNKFFFKRYIHSFR